MSKREYYFSGKAGYVSKNGRKFGEEPEKWSMRLYPRTAADRAEIKATGIKNKTQEDDGVKSGVEGLYYTFRSNTPYPITDKDGNDITVLVGNGSEVTVKLEVEAFNSPKYGAQARSKLLGVIVTNLIEYKPEEAKDEASSGELPA